MSIRTDFKVATWNILVDSYKDVAKPSLKGMSWDIRSDMIVGRVQRMGADVVCFQEVDKFDSLAEKMETVGYWGVYAPRNNRQNEGCALFYNNREIEVIHPSDQKLHFFDDGTGRVIQQVTVKMKSAPGSKPITVLNTHIVNAFSGIDSNQIVGNQEEKLGPSFAKRQAEIALLAQKSVEAAQGDKPVIVCGDFNISASCPAFVADFTKNGFKDSLVGTENEHKPTVAFGGTHKQQGAQNVFKRIDFVLSKNLTGRESDVRGNPADLDTSKEASDHLAILARYVLPY